MKNTINKKIKMDEKRISFLEKRKCKLMSRIMKYKIQNFITFNIKKFDFYDSFI